MIDKEHDDLIRQLNSLLNHPDAQPGDEKFSETLSQLGGQIFVHFNHEEKLLKSLGMPENEIASHIQAHTNILDQYAQLNYDILLGKFINTADALLMLEDWIVGHVVSFDLNIKKYLLQSND